jgi:uncharacterized protein YecA (UPF0149 family)
MTNTELKQLELDIMKLTNGESNNNLPRWMDENMTTEQMARYFDILTKDYFDDCLNEAGWLMAIHTCPYEIRFRALRQVMKEVVNE